MIVSALFAHANEFVDHYGSSDFTSRPAVGLSNMRMSFICKRAVANLRSGAVVKGSVNNLIHPFVYEQASCRVVETIRSFTVVRVLRSRHLRINAC